MTADQLSKHFLLWFQKTYPDARIYRNNSGLAKRNKSVVRFGIPPVGGPDFIAFINKKITRLRNGDGSFREIYDLNKNYLTVEFYEIKTKKDRMSQAQKNFANLVTNMGGEYWVVKENDADKNGFILEKWSVK